MTATKKSKVKEQIFALAPIVDVDPVEFEETWGQRQAREAAERAAEYEVYFDRRYGSGQKCTWHPINQELLGFLRLQLHDIRTSGLRRDYSTIITSYGECSYGKVRVDVALESTTYHFNSGYGTSVRTDHHILVYGEGEEQEVLRTLLNAVHKD